MSACYKKKIKLQKQKAKQVTFPENTSLCDKVCQVTCDKSVVSSTINLTAMI